MHPARSPTTPPRKKPSLVTWRRSPPRLNSLPVSSSSTNQSINNEKAINHVDGDMEDMFAPSKPFYSKRVQDAIAAPSPDHVDALFLEWTTTPAPPRPPPPPNFSSSANLATKQELVSSSPVVDESDLFLEAACHLAEANAVLGQLPAKSHSSIRKGHFIRLQVASLPELSTDRKSMRIYAIDLDSSSTIELVLRGTWLDCTINESFRINVCLSYEVIVDTTKSLVVDDEHHLLVVNPQELISPTKIADAISCSRRVILRDTLGGGASSRDAVLGNLKHSLVEAALGAERFDIDFLRNTVPLLVEQLSHQLFCIEMTENEARDHLFVGVEALHRWGVQMFTVGIPVEFSPAQWDTVRIVKVVAVECEVSSEMFGMKGVMDCICVVELQSDGRRFVAPLEIKTGKPVVRNEHRAQTMMYSLMLSDRYAVDKVNDGLLLQACFTESDFRVLGVSLRRNEIKELVRIRNSLTVGLSAVSTNAECDRCFQREICALVEKPHSLYFTNWYEIMSKEAAHQHRGRAFAPYRATKRSLLNLKLEEIPTGLGVWRFRLPEIVQNTELGVEDWVVVSLQDAHYGVFRGTITALDNTHVVVACDDTGGGGTRFASFAGMLSATWCLEKRDFSLSGPLSSLATLMLDKDMHKQRIRQLLTDEDDGVSPQYWDTGANPFIRNCSSAVLEYCLNIATSTEDVRRHLAKLRNAAQAPPPISRSSQTQNIDLSSFTPDQVQAIASVFTTRDFLCVAGAPGAGKTYLLTFLIQLLSQRLGKSVLIVTYTNAACDHLMSKLDAGVNALRIGNRSGVRPDLHERLMPQHCSTAQLESYLHNPQLVVGVTCFGARNNALLQRKRFDYCVLDEASQVTELNMLPAWFCSKVLIAVGDPLQLPPLIVTQSNVKSCLEVLMSKRNSLVVRLCTQFRMNADINLLANTLFYNATLRCGTEQVMQQRLLLDSQWETSSMEWIVQAVNPLQSIAFCNTDAIGLALEQGQESGICNDTECLIVAKLVDHLTLQCELELGEIGVISPYRTQLAKLRAAMPHFQLEIDTVDKYQGREKTCIIVSMVRSNVLREVGSLLADYRRLNVAFSRAKCKLIVIGSQHTLQNNETLNQFLTLVRQREWCVQVSMM